MLAQRAVRTYVFFRSSSPCPSSLRRNLPSNAFLLRRVKWKGGSQKDRVTGREMGQRERKKKKEEEGAKLIATFCLAINDDKEGRETFRWLREDVFSFSLITPHPPFSPSVSPLCLFPISPSFYVKLSVTLNNNNNNDDRPAKRHQRKKILGVPRKRLRSLYTLQSTSFGRLLALES